MKLKITIEAFVEHPQGVFAKPVDIVQAKFDQVLSDMGFKVNATMVDIEADRTQTLSAPEVRGQGADFPRAGALTRQAAKPDRE